MKHMAAPFLMLAILAAPVHAQTGSLDTIRKDVRTPKAEPKAKSDNDDDDEDSFLSLLLADLLTFDISPAARTLYFTNFPYEGGYTGFLAEELDSENPPANPAKIHWNNWMGRAALETGHSFSPAIHRVQASVQVDSTFFGLLVHTDLLSERRAAGDWDHLGLSDVTLTCALVRVPVGVIRAGVGVRTLFDRHQTDWGYNLHLDADIAPHRPWLLSLSGDAGTVGEASVYRGRATVGVLFRRWEAYAGYDYLRIGSTSIQGPLVGVRLWF